MTRHVPISEFKDHASELVAAAEGGEEILITRHGKIAARLVAVDEMAAAKAAKRAKVQAALARLAELREEMRAQGHTVTQQEIADWKNEGRP